MSYATWTVEVDVSGNALWASPTWTDITAYVCHDTMQVAYGRARGADEFQPGTASFSLINIDGRFDPTKTTGAYYPDFTMRTRVRITGLSPGTWGDTIIFQGFIARIDQRWNHRAEQIAVVQATDLLGVLATLELPESAWDHLIEGRSGKVVWHKPGSDTTATAWDYSGNNYHGNYKTYENLSGPYEGTPTPTPVIAAGIADSVIPDVGRPARSWGKMVTEAGQPLDVTFRAGGNWRATALVCHPATESLADPSLGDCSIEMWLSPQISWVIDGTPYGGDNGACSTSLIQWGAQPPQGLSDVATVYGPWFRYGFSSFATGSTTPSLVDFEAGGTLAAGSIGAVVPAGTLLANREPCHLAIVRDGSDVDWYVNGELSASATLLSHNWPRGFPMLIGAAIGAGRNQSGAIDAFAGCWSTIGDVVVYNRTLTTTEIEDSFAAGKATSFPTAGEAAFDVAIVVSADVATGASFVTSSAVSHRVRPSAWGRRSALEVLREYAAADGAALYAEGSSLRFTNNRWDIQDGDWYDIALVDDDTTSADLPYAQPVAGHDGISLSLSTDGLVNDCTVGWDGGETRAENATSVGTFARFRRSISTPLALAVEARGRAEFEVFRKGTPQVDIGTVNVEPTTDEEWDAALTVTIGAFARVIATRPDGSKIDGVYAIERIAWSIDMGQGPCRLSLGLTPANEAAGAPGRPLIIGNADFGLIGGPGVVWY